MSVFRVKHQENFVVLHKEILENPNISLKAKGLWAFCMSKPNDWEFHVKQLETTLLEGKDALYNIINELLHFGYCRRITNKDEKGKWTTVDYEIYENTFLNKNDARLKKRVPNPGFPDTDNPQLLKNDKKLSIEKRVKKEKKTPAATPISLNSETKKFEGIAEEDIKRWQDTFPAVNIRKEIAECLLWALGEPRSNYRKSINTWMKNVNKSHTTPFQPNEEKMKVPATQEEQYANRRMADHWEEMYSKNPRMHYGVQSQATKVVFIMPNNEGYAVEFNLMPKEFYNLCQKATKKMGLTN
jgi:hypothetical protein